MISRGSGSNDPRQRAREERARREAAALPPEPVAPPASAAEARAAREARAAGGAPVRRSARDEAAARTARGETATPRTARGERTAPKRRRWSKGKVAAVATSLVLAALVVGAVAGFAWLRWFSVDDAADIQGTWYLAGTATPIEITEDRIVLTDDVSYRYALNPGDKTIAFTFTNLAGSGCYRFSLDRQELALVDGSFTGADTLGRDMGWLVEALVKKLQGDKLAPAEAGGEGLTLLSRTPTGSPTAKARDEEDPKADKAAGSASKKKTETIEDEAVGDLSGKLPADINEPTDKAADEGASPSDSKTR